MQEDSRYITQFTKWKAEKAGNYTAYITIKDMTGLSDYFFAPDKLEAYGDANYLKGGIVYADYVTTVSETYAGEIQMPFYGEGLDGLMRARNNCLCGIVNGIDYSEYNPETDKYIWHPIFFW